MPNQPRQFGGSFPPPLTDEKLSEYRTLAESEPASPVRDAILTLLKCCENWWNLSESTTQVIRKHSSGVGSIVPLSKENMAALDNDIPWGHELESIQGLFDGIDPAKKELRNAAFHLLWHVKELYLDREPITADKL